MPISEQVMRDLRDVVRANRGEAMSDAGQRLVFRVLPSLLDEVESLRDRTLQKDFVALYQSARMLTSGWVPGSPSTSQGDVEHLGLQVVRLASLYDDVRLNLNTELARQAWPVERPLPFVLQGAVPARPGPPHRSEVDPSLLDEVDLTLAGPHTVRVLQSDGTGRVECDHTFKGTARCVHCGKAFDELRAEAQAELARLLPQLPDGVLHATPDKLADIVQRQLDEHEARGIINREALDRTIASGRIEGAGTDEVRLTFTAPPMHEAFEDPPPDEVAVPITLGPSLRPRVEALVATGRLGSDLERVVQTLFVLGMLDAEGQDPQAHVGAPHSHVSAEALFVRFGLPHEGGEQATRQRASILRQLLLDLSEWCDEGDPLRRAFAAAIEALPR